MSLLDEHEQFGQGWEGDTFFEQPKGEDSPMEVKNFFSATPFVRNGFGRQSATTDGVCSKKTTVKHCITQLNSANLAGKHDTVLNENISTTRSILVYSDRPLDVNGAESKANCAKKPAETESSLPSLEPVTAQTGAEEDLEKSAYHSYYVFPRSKGNSKNSPNLLWHEMNLKNLNGERGRSLSPEMGKKKPPSYLPASSVLVKTASLKRNPDEQSKIIITEKPLLSRDKVDKALETLKKQSSFARKSPRLGVIRNTKHGQTEQLSKPATEPEKKQEDPMKVFTKTGNDLVECEPSIKRLNLDTPQFQFEVVVAIDFGTTFSGYAYSFCHDPENIHIMRKWEGDDPGLSNQKTPTILLLKPNQQFHSFGFSARDYYHDLDQNEARRWFYFDKFKMILHHNKDIGRDTMVKAANGKEMPAMAVFAMTLGYFRDHALRELSDSIGQKLSENEVRWVITVPAIWRQRAKQFMREAAYQAGIGSDANPEHLLLALEPEAASINCRKLRMNQLVPERPRSIFTNLRDNDNMSQCSDFVLEDSGADSGGDSDESLDTLDGNNNNTTNQAKKSVRFCIEPQVFTDDIFVNDGFNNGGRYMVVDCGGGTVDITVHEITTSDGQLKELFKATGGPYGSVSVDDAFKALMEEIFGKDIMEAFKKKRPAGFVDLMIAFESRKRGCSPNKLTPLNIALPFSFIDFYRRHKGKDVGMAINKYGNKDIKWVSHGMLRIEVTVMKRLFEYPLSKIIEHIKRVLESPNFTKSQEHPEGGQIGHLFLVGGFAESAIVQEAIRAEFGQSMNVIIPQGVGVAVLRGAVLYGLDPSIVHVRRAMKTYGIGVIKPFIHGQHPSEKLVVKDDHEWCMDVFDTFVLAGQSVTMGEAVVRKYRPVSAENNHIVLHIFSTDRDDVKFITDPGVEACGSLNLTLDPLPSLQSKCREIQAKMLFGDTEIKATAIDVATNQSVKVYVDFMNENNPKYITKL